MLQKIRDTESDTVYWEMDRRTYVVACCVIFGLLLTLSGYLFHLHTLGTWAHDLRVSLEKETMEMEASNRRLQTKILYSGFTSNRQIATILNGENAHGTFINGIAASASYIDSLSAIHKFGILSAVETYPKDSIDTQGSLSSTDEFSRHFLSPRLDRLFMTHPITLIALLLIGLVIIWHYTANFFFGMFRPAVVVVNSPQSDSSSYAWVLWVILFVILASQSRELYEVFASSE